MVRYAPPHSTDIIPIKPVIVGFVEAPCMLGVFPGCIETEKHGHKQDLQIRQPAGRLFGGLRREGLPGHPRFREACRGTEGG